MYATGSFYILHYKSTNNNIVKHNKLSDTHVTSPTL